MKSRKFIGILLAFLMFASIFAIVSFTGNANATSTPPYTVTFNEAKLPVGTTWGIVLSNSTKTITATNKTISTGGSISESLYNGTYYYNVTGTPWWFNSTHGKFTISGSSLTITINFIENFTLNITETGWSNQLLPNQKLASGYALQPASWGIKVNGTSYFTTTNYNNIKLPASTYNLNILNSTIAVKTTSTLSTTTNVMEYISNITNQNIVLNSNKTISITYTPYIIDINKFLGTPPYNVTFYNSKIIPDGSFSYLIPYNSTITYSIKLTNYNEFFLNATTFNSVTLNGIISNTSVSQILFNTNHTFVNITAHVYGPFNPFFITSVTIKNGFSPELIYDHYGMLWNSTQARYLLNLTLIAGELLAYPRLPSNEIQNATTYISVYPDKTLVEYGTYIPIPNGTYALSLKMTIFNHIIYYNGSLYGFNSPSKLITIQGYVTPHDANIFNIYSLNGNTLTQNLSNGYYNLTLPAKNFILFYNNSYIPQVFYVSSSGWLNVTLQKYTFSYNITPSIFDYNYSKGGILNFSKIPVKASIMSNIIFYKISNNTFYLSSNFTNNLTAYAPLHIILPVLKDRKYLFSIKTNLTNQPYYNYTFNTTNNAYYNFTYDWWGIDPTVSYYAYPVAVITAPTAVAYDSAILISGANSIASTNATITNYTWKITGPQNQLYTEYGKTITMYFSITGLYTVTLTVTDSNGLTNTTKTTITVVSANQDPNIQISYSLTILSNGYYQYNITINAKDNVSISQFLASVDSVYVNATLIKQVGYEYYYVVKFNPDAFGYGNHTIKFEAINSLDGYNTAITYAIFGSLNQGGIMAYILGHIALTIVIIIFIIIILSFIYVEYRHKIIKKISNAKRITRSKNSKRVKK